MKLKLIEPISLKLMRVGRAYLNVLSDQMDHLEMNRYYYALTLICYHDGELTQKALAEKLGKDKSLIVNIIDTLTEKGFVYREINPADRREHLIKVTDKAKNAVPQIIESFEIMNNRIKANISTKEMETFENVLFKMKSNLEEFPTEKRSISNPT